MQLTKSENLVDLIKVYCKMCMEGFSEGKDKKVVDMSTHEFCCHIRYKCYEDVLDVIKMLEDNLK